MKKEVKKGDEPETPAEAPAETPAEAPAEAPKEEAEAPAAAPEAPAEAPAEAPKADEESADEENTVDTTELAEAQKAIKRLAQVAKLFSDPPEGETETEEPLPEEITNLVAAAEKAMTLELTEKSADTVRRIHSALGKILSDEGTASEDPETPRDDEIVETKTVEVDPETIAKAVSEHLEDLRTGQQEIVRTFTEQFTAMTNEMAGGLESLARGFKDFVDAKIAEVETRIQDINKSADERLGQLEKAAGTSKRITGSESDVATGAQPINKEGRRPSANRSVWGGIFGDAPKKQLAAR